MAQHDKQVAAAFLKAWGPEFAKSVEMFTGKSVSIQPGPKSSSENTSGPDAAIVWHRQAVECGSTGSVWIGTPAATLIGITETLAPDAETRESLYQELLRQSLEGAAHVLSSGRESRMRCREALGSGAPPPDLADLTTVWLNLADSDPLPLLVGFQSDFIALLSAVEQDSSVEAVGVPPKTQRSRAEAEAESGWMMDRLADLELPAAVVLGRARVRIQEALKLTAGSLIELDRLSGDPVEIIVHNAVVARGEVVSVAGNYGVKIREVISRSDRAALQASRAMPGVLQRQ